MGNIFLKSTAHSNNKLFKSLIETNLEERIRYLEEKLENLDNDFFVFRGNTNANIQVMSKDITYLGRNHNRSSLAHLSDNNNS